jgi:hypothetical protein
VQPPHPGDVQKIVQEGLQSKPTLRKLSAIASACAGSLSITSTLIDGPAVAVVVFGFVGMSR